MKVLKGLLLAAVFVAIVPSAQAQTTGAGAGGYNYPYIPVVDEINNCMAWLLFGSESKPARPAPKPKPAEIVVAAEVCADILVKDQKPAVADPKRDSIKKPNLGLGGVISK